MTIQKVSQAMMMGMREGGGGWMMYKVEMGSGVSSSTIDLE